MSRIWAWLAFAIGMIYFFVPLIGTLEFSLRMRRGVYSLDAYRVVLADPRFQATFLYSTVMALFTILLGVLIVVPTAYWVRLKLPRWRPFVEFLTRRRLEDASAGLGLRWRRHRVLYPLAYELRPLLARLRRRRPPSRFDLWQSPVP